MAFVQPSSSTLLRRSTFTSSIDARRPSKAPSTAIRMGASVEGSEPKVVGTAGKSDWKENLLVGGFPGGEGFFKKWISDGMKDDVPDMPSFMQPSAEFKPSKKVPGTGILAVLDRTEFFEGYEAQISAPVEESSEEESSTPIKTSKSPIKITDETDLTPSDVLNTEIPDDSVYGKYFPESHRNKAPFITLEENESNSYYNRIGCSILPVTSSPTDLCYPKEVKNKAPFIDISYNGCLATASVTLSLETVEPLPTLPPPPIVKDEAVVSLNPGAGGGLKLNFMTSGEKVPL